MKITLLSLLCAACAANAFSLGNYIQNDIEVGANPIDIFVDVRNLEDETPPEIVYVLCAGVDQNGNGTVDNEDTKASIWKVDDEGQQSIVLEMETIFPLANAKVFNAGADYFFPATDGNVYSFSLDTETLQETSVYDGNVISIFTADTENGKFNLYLEEDENKNNELRMEVPNFGTSLDAGNNGTMMTLVGTQNSQALNIASINHDGSEQLWHLQYGPIQLGFQSYWDYAEITLPGMVSDILFILAGEESNELVLTGQEKNELYLVNIDTEQLVNTIKLGQGTVGPNAGWPVQEGVIALTYNDNKVLLYDLINNTSKELPTSAPTGKVLGIAGQFMATMPIDSEGNINNKVVLFSASTSVETEFTSETAATGLVFTQSSQSLALDAQGAYQVYGVDGKLRFSGTSTSDIILQKNQFDAPGVYFIRTEGKSFRLIVE